MKEEQNWCFAVMAKADPEEPRAHLKCDRCGEQLVTVLPLRMETYIEILKGFSRAHAHCPPKEAT